MTARLIDRVGKGIRGAPRDALIADLTPPQIRGAAFGLRQSLDTIGAFSGPLLAMALMLAWNDDFRAVFWVAVIPGMLSFLLIAFGVREPDAPPAPRAPPIRFDRATLARLGAAFWGITAAATAMTLARFSEAFLILRGADLGMHAAYAPLVLVGMNGVYSFTAYPVGRLADRMSSRTLLFVGLAFLAAADIVLACASSLAMLAAGVALWGLHMGFTQGVFAAMVANAAPPDLRGTAFGAFNLASGVAMLVASALAGALWQFAGPAATFVAGALLAALSFLITALALRGSR